MQLLGNKISTLRKNKGLTQEQLAQVLSISAQAISKWENSLATPDIQLLPVLARFFGITMDELFNYRLDALSYKERFIRFMVDNGALQFGEFYLQSGRVSPYYIDTEKYKSAAQITKLGKFYAECISENNAFSDYLYGRTNKEIPLVIAAGMVLYEKYGRDIECYFGVLPETNQACKKIVIVEDTLTSGNTLSKTIEQIQSQNDCEIHVIVSVDRNERGESPFICASEDIVKKFKVKLHSIVTFQDIISAVESGVISSTEHLRSLLDYKNKYTLEV